MSQSPNKPYNLFSK